MTNSDGEFDNALEFGTTQPNGKTNRNSLHIGADSICDHIIQVELTKQHRVG